MEILHNNSDYLQGIVDFLHETRDVTAQQKALLQRAHSFLSPESQALYEEHIESSVKDNVTAMVDFCVGLAGQGIKLFMTLDTSSAEVCGFGFNLESCQYKVIVIPSRPDQPHEWVLEDISRLHIQPARAWVETQ